MNYLWALFIITAITDGVDKGDYRYTRIETFESRYTCEIMKDLFVQKYGPMQKNDEIKCLKVDE